MKNTSQGYPRNYTANTTGDILQVAEKIYFMAKVSTTPFSLGINRISYLYEKMSQNKKGTELSFRPFCSVSCLTRIRTSTDRTKNCSATITP